jgi:hypothetical protein
VATLLGAIVGGAIALLIAILVVSWIGARLTDATDVLLFFYVTPVLLIVGLVAGAVLGRKHGRRDD